MRDAGPDIALAVRLLESLDSATRRGPGIVRDSYGDGEQRAHDMVRDCAATLGLAVRVDEVGNLYVTLKGRDPAAPRLMIGSHLDSVDQGGNVDGAAGVAAGIAILAGWRAAGLVPARDVTVIALRAEEGTWFDIPYCGSRAAFALLDPTALQTARPDTGQTLAEAMRALGFEPDAIATRRRQIDPAALRAYLELHIEQGPVLVAQNLPAASVSGIRGYRRFREASCHGVSGHSGALPRAFRADAVAATVALLHAMETAWLRREAAGEDLVVTAGQFATDPATHGPSKVAGRTQFALDIRSQSPAVLDAMEAELREAADRVAAQYRVRFDLGAMSASQPAAMDTGLRQRVLAALPTPFEMASGAGHDAAVFALLGVPTAMVFVRNEHGSHNPLEAMDIADFAIATRALADVAAPLAGIA